LINNIIIQAKQYVLGFANSENWREREHTFFLMQELDLILVKHLNFQQLSLDFGLDLEENKVKFANFRWLCS
jgi:hypothetical protein